jgi:hypothetical protein
MPEIEVPGGGPGTDPQMHEYLRRLAMARMDYAHLRTELSRRFPAQFHPAFLGFSRVPPALTFLTAHRGS